MQVMKILMVSPEFHPYAKVGGLGDVVGALPKYLARLGHDVRVCLPLYGNIQPKPNWKAYENIPVYLGGHCRICRIWETQENSVTIYFIEYAQYFDRHEIYAGPWGAHADNGERFTFLTRAAIDLCYAFQWHPDVIHAHDWTTGLLPVYLNTTERFKPLGQAASVFTIHNLQHQGIFNPDILAYAGIPYSEYRSDSLESVGCVNFMKGAIYHSTKLTTVSPNYAREIQTPEYGFGLHTILKFKSADLVGILNGIDDDIWNPQTDPYIPANYSIKNFSGKKICKLTLQKECKLEVNPNVFLLGVISRLYQQKGLDVLMDILPYLCQNLKLQVIVLGSGEASWESRLKELAQAFPNQIATHIGYNTTLAHRIEAGIDAFIMPSRFEPCGLNQMYSMRYGSLPIVRNTGGLTDSVKSLDENTENGCGFVFENLTNDALYNSIGWACATYYDRPKLFRKMQKCAMQQDFSWHCAAKKYEQVYQWAIQKRLSGIGLH